MLSFVTLIAYDFRYALKTIKRYYPIADEIILGLDKDRMSFAKKPFAFDMASFTQSLNNIDSLGKIRIVEENFHLFDHPMTNDQYERKVLASACKPGNWIVQIDADEFLVNPDEFAQWIKGANSNVCITGQWVTIFKQFGDDYLIVEEPSAHIAIGTKARDRYVASRITDQTHVKSPLIILHQAWGRTRDELELKLKNWAHSKDFDVDAYLSYWDSVTLQNYEQQRNFHPICPAYWPSLEKVRLSSFAI